MFTGIVEEMGTVTAVSKLAHLYKLTIKAKKVLISTKIADSIAVNGVCLTVVARKQGELTFDVIQETLDKTSIGYATKGTHVNLERALRASDRFGGHFVSGHVDGLGVVTKIESDKNYVKMTIRLPKSLMKYLAPKGSVTVEGISLTMGEVARDSFAIHLIPFTMKVTTLGLKKVGDMINIETDILAKYLLASRRK